MSAGSCHLSAGRGPGSSSDRPHFDATCSPLHVRRPGTQMVSTPVRRALATILAVSSTRACYLARPGAAAAFQSDSPARGARRSRSPRRASEMRYAGSRYCRSQANRHLSCRARASTRLRARRSDRSPARQTAGSARHAWWAKPCHHRVGGQRTQATERSRERQSCDVMLHVNLLSHRRSAPARRRPSILIAFRRSGRALGVRLVLDHR